MRARRPRMTAATLGVIVSIGVLGGMPAVASASVRQLSIIQDSQRLLTDPVKTLATFRALGANTVRVIVTWALIAPNPTASRPPRGFDAADPAAYPVGNWAPYDAIVKLAA